MPKRGVGNALYKIAMKKYLGQLMMLKGGGSKTVFFKIAVNQYLGHLMMDKGRFRNSLFKIAAKQCLVHLMTIDYA